MKKAKGGVRGAGAKGGRRQTKQVGGGGGRWRKVKAVLFRSLAEAAVGNTAAALNRPVPLSSPWLLSRRFLKSHTLPDVRDGKKEQVPTIGGREGKGSRYMNGIRRDRGESLATKKCSLRGDSDSLWYTADP